MPDVPYYQSDLALVHHRGFGFHADGCAPGIVELLAPVRSRGGVVLELGCGSGRLTRHLIDAGHRVIASDASQAMLDLTRQTVPDAEDIRQLVLPDDPLPQVDAVVSVGHCLSYLDDQAQVDRALSAAAKALLPGGVLAVDLCDLRWAQARLERASMGLAKDDWAMITEFSVPAPDKYIRDITTFVARNDGSWRRSFEHHENVLVDTAQVPGLLARNGVEAAVHTGFGDYELPEGLVAIIGRRTG